MSDTKDPRFVAAGTRSAWQRWGVPKSARLDDLDESTRRRVHELLANLKQQAQAARGER